MRRLTVICSTPYCSREVYLNPVIKRKGYYFCRECRSQHSYYVLVAQAQHGYPIKDVILDAASLFQTVAGMSDYVGVSFVTMYTWLDKFFGMSFQEFKRTHICKSPNCYTLNIQGNSYSRYDYVIKKIKRKWFCACSNVLDKNLITTNAPLNVMASVLKGNPRMERVNDDRFILAPEPFKFPICPVFSGLHPVYT